MPALAYTPPSISMPKVSHLALTQRAPHLKKSAFNPLNHGQPLLLPMLLF
jgi:hypothetical protein